jgi:predicted methyltransferase
MLKLPLGALCALSLVACASASAQREENHRHHGHHQRFKDPEKWKKRFEGPARDRWQRPQRVLALLGLKPGMRAAEIGAGTGYFAVRLARAVGPSGRAFGVDIEPGMVRHLARRAQEEKLPQLMGVLGATGDPRLPEAVDLVFLCNTYLHLEQRTDYFRRVQARIRDGGRLAVVDFKMGEIPVGPPESMRVTPARLDRELVAAGYRRVTLDETTLPYQYVAIYERAP